MALVYDKHNGGVSKYSQWAKGQMEYLMGDNPLEDVTLLDLMKISKISSS